MPEEETTLGGEESVDESMDAEEVDADDDSQSSEEDYEDTDTDDDDKEQSVPYSRFRDVNRKMREYQEQAELVQEIQRATGMSPSEIRSKLSQNQPQSQTNAGSSIDYETRQMALEAKRDAQIARLVRQEPDAADILDVIEDDFMDAKGKLSAEEIYSKYKRAMKVGLKNAKRRQTQKRRAQVESGGRTRTEMGGVTVDKFKKLSTSDKEKQLRKMGLIS